MTRHMRCPYCRSHHVVPDITVRWSQLRGRLRPVRGHFCTGCGRPFSEVPVGDLEHVGGDQSVYGVEAERDEEGIAAALRELNRVLDARGRALVTVPCGA